MPIEIKELNIKINVDGAQSATPASGANQSAQTKPLNIDEIIRVLKKKEER